MDHTTLEHSVLVTEVKRIIKIILNSKSFIHLCITPIIIGSLANHVDNELYREPLKNECYV